MNRHLLDARLDRRQLLHGLAAAAATAALPKAVQASPLEGRARPGAAGFEATWANHYTYIAPDLNKTVDWYLEVYGMQRGDSDSTHVQLWFSDAGRDTLMIVRQARPGEQAPGVEKLAFTIDAWNQRAIEAELKRRGLQPISDTDRGFWFLDVEGNEIGVFAKDFMVRPAARAARPSLWKAQSVNHIQINTMDHRKMDAWYKDLLGLTMRWEDENQGFLWFGDSIIVPYKAKEVSQTSAAQKRLDHVAYTIENYDHAAVEAELNRRGLKPRNSFGHSWYHVDVNGFKIQTCNKDLVPFAEDQLLHPKR